MPLSIKTHSRLAVADFRLAVEHLARMGDRRDLGAERWNAGHRA